MSYRADIDGEFNINMSVQIEKIEFVYIGHYVLTLEEIPNTDTLKFDTIAISTRRVGDDYFITIKMNGKRDRKRRKQTEIEMNRQASQAYIVYERKKIRAQNGLILMEPSLTQQQRL